MRTRRLVAKVLFVVAAVCVVAFAVTNAIGWHTYNTTVNSAPFSALVLARAIVFLLPAAVLLVIGFILEHEPKQKTGE